LVSETVPNGAGVRWWGGFLSYIFYFLLASISPLICIQVQDDTAETSKPGYVNFKNAVWHESFKKLLQSIIPLSKSGFWVECGDRKKRQLFPLVLILTADYEEA